MTFTNCPPSPDEAVTHPREHELGYFGPRDVRCLVCEIELDTQHECTDFIENYSGRPRPYRHGLECGRCGANIQEG